jgi:hypothetical protein
VTDALITLSFVVATSVLVLVLVLTLLEQNSKRPKRPRPKPKLNYNDPPPEWALKQVVSYTHDRDTAERLLLTCRAQNPVKDWGWVADRVVGDLMRDRGYSGRRPTYQPPASVRSYSAPASHQVRSTSRVVNFPKPVAYFIVLSMLSFGLTARGYNGGLGFNFTSNSGEGTGYGEVRAENLANFPPPSRYQQVGGSTAVLTMINGSPDALTLKLERSDGERLTLQLPGCGECRAYPKDQMPDCGTVGQWRTFRLPPGQYEVVGTFFGGQRTKGFRSAWTMDTGWEYRDCIYTLNEPQFY